MTLETLRRAKNLSQKELAAKIGVDQSSVSMWECGTTTPRAIYVEPLADALGVDVSEVLRAISK